MRPTTTAAACLSSLSLFTDHASRWRVYFSLYHTLLFVCEFEPQIKPPKTIALFLLVATLWLWLLLLTVDLAHALPATIT